MTQKLVTLRIKGGLGNQLFIYAFYLYIKKKTTKRILFDESEFAVSFRKNRLDLLLNENINMIKTNSKNLKYVKIPDVYEEVRQLDFTICLISGLS